MNHSMDSLPQELPPCPNCGASHWRFQDIPGHAHLQQRLLIAVEKLIVVDFVLFLGSLMIFYAPIVHKFGYLCIGALLILTPLIIFILRWLVPNIYSAMQICQKCDYIAKA